jgi:hypothetical protein
LRQVYARGDLTAPQLAELVRIAAAHRRPVERELIYAMLFVELRAGALMDALIGFESAEDEATRIRAGYALKEQYRGKAVPDRVADAAARVSLQGSNAELRGIAAGLLSHTGEGGGNRERYGADPDISISFRTRIIRELGKQPVTENGLSAEVENTLKEVARDTDDYYLVQAAGKTLRAWGIQPPLRVAFRNHDNQSRALFAVLIGLVIVNLIACITGLINLFRLPLRSEGQRRRGGIRTGMVIGWLALSVGMTVLLAAGAVGFLGHNSAPKPADTLMWNIPAYGGTVIYLFLACVLKRWGSRSAARQPGESAGL